MARSYPAPDPFPGQRPDGWTLGGTSPDTPAWALDAEPDGKDYDVAQDPSLTQTITPGAKGLDSAGSGTVAAFPGAAGSQPGGGSVAGGAYGGGAGALTQATRPSDSGSTVGGMRVLNAPNAFPGGDQILGGAGDTTGTTGPRRLRRDPSAGTQHTRYGLKDNIYLWQVFKHGVT